MNAVKTFLYMGSLHGFFTYYLPWQLASYDPWEFNIEFFHWLAIPLWLTGTLILLRCSVDIIHRGQGTPSHFDPPKSLLERGLYRHVRNPIYLGALLIQSGTIIWHTSVLLIMYLLFFILAFHILIVFFEEPVLQNKFGAAYNEYVKRVPRWIPRLLNSDPK